MMYQSSNTRARGTSYNELVRKARKEYNVIKSHTKRQPYARSKYFRKDKVFIKLFWDHLDQKNRHDRTRRLSFYACAIELIRNTVFEPSSRENPNSIGEILHRFEGISADGQLFCVQIKEDKRSGRKDFISAFPYKNK